MFFRRKKKSEPTESATTATQDASTAVGDSPSVQPSDPETPPVAEASSAPNAESEQAAHTQNEATDDKKESVFARIKRGLSRTTNQLGDGIGNLVLGKKEIDDELLEDIESQLLMADVGVDATTKIIDDLTQRVARKQLADGDALFKALRETLTDMLKVVEAPLVIDTSKQPFVVLVVGVNGVGKTTTIGKLAKRFQNQGHSVMLAAGDTFRAAAVEQLKVWGERNDVPVVAQATGSDSASVIFDAVQSAQARNIDIVIADTAGRLHNKSHLMDELSKVRRVMAKLDDSAPHETLLVLDAGTGQNALSQAEQFNQAVGVTGIALTKLDGTAKGGVVFALSEKFALPVRYIGVGEAIDDLQPFAADAFAEAVFSQGS
ncbi:signal recognition particle-docking protein FtsY [Aurantivibrio plasticivorans]